MSENLENLRSKSREARLRLEGNFGVQASQDTDDAQRRLYSLFTSAVESRETMLERFSSLVSLRLEAYEAAISGYISSYYASEISRNVGEIDVLFRVAEIFSSAKFSKEFDTAVYLIENNYEEPTLTSLAAYFELEFEKVVGIAFPDEEVTYTVSSGLTVDSTPVANPESNPNKIYLALSVLGKLKEVDNPDMASDISALKEFIVGQSETSLPSTIVSNIASRIEAISDHVSSKRFMDKYRSDKDPSYKPEADAEVSSKMSKLVDSARAFSDLSNERPELARETGIYDGMVSLATEILSDSDDAISSAIDAIEEMEFFIEDYQPFARLPVSENSAVASAFKVCEDASLDYQQYQEEFGFGSFFSPFRTASLEGDVMVAKIPFAEWASSATEARRINGSNFEMALLYIGTKGRGFLKEATYKRASNYSFSSIFRKGSIKASQLIETYRVSQGLSSSLTSESGVRVSPDPSNEKIPFAIKASLPGLEVLDYIDYSPALLFNSSTPNASEASLRNNIRLIVLEQIGKIRKDRLAETLRSLVSALISYRRENLKGLYTEICIRSAIELMEDHLDNLDAPSEQTRIDVNTRIHMQSYLSRTFRDSETQEETLERWLSQYIASHAALYGSGATGDIVSDALLGEQPDGTQTLKKFLLG